MRSSFNLSPVGDGATLSALVVALVFLLGGAVTARSQTLLDRDTCVKFAMQKKTLEDAGVRDLLQQAPADVAARQGPQVVESVKRYIALSEKVLFQCPVHVLNATAAPLEERERYLPPLPRKGPKRNAGQLLRGPLIPLPVQRQQSGWTPNSQG